MEGYPARNDGGVAMTRFTQDTIQSAAENLARLIEMNELKRPEDRISHCATCVTEDGMLVAVNGSAHRLEGLFVNLLERRPELRQVMQSAIDMSYKVATR